MLVTLCPPAWDGSLRASPPVKGLSQFTRWRPPTVRQTLLGVASFHRAYLLAQDFTHEPACQTGERAPQGRFRHQPEQMVHPPFAWQLASFPSLPAERRPRIAPCGTSAPYGHIPQKSRYSKLFLSPCQCTRNWLHLWVHECPIIGGFSCEGQGGTRTLWASSKRMRAEISSGHFWVA